MIRSLFKPILVLSTLLLAPGIPLRGQDSKPVPAEGKPTVAEPQVAAKDATTKAKAKAAKLSAKEAGASTKGPKATYKQTAKPQVNYNTGEPPVSAKPTPKLPKPKPLAQKKSAKLPMSQRVDINTASKEELKKLPGIFDVEADKIIAHRPYKSKAGLLVDAGLTGAQYFSIKDRVAAGKPPAK